MGKGSETSTSTVTSELPEFYKPYLTDILARAQHASSQPYPAYPGQRVAYFSPMEQEAMARVGELGVSGTPPELNLAGQATSQWLGGWNPNIAQGISMNYSPGAPTGVGFSADARTSQYTAGQIGAGDDYVAGQREVGFVPGTLNDPEVIKSYMDPYFQNVLDIEKRELGRQADARNAQYGLQAAGSGSLGGYREAMIRAENERNLMQQMGDVQTRGTQSAYQQALQSMEADRQARAQLEQFGQSQFSINEALRQRQAELVQQGFGLEEAARRAEEELAQSQFGMNEQSRQFGAGLGLQAYQAYEQAKQAAAQMGLSAQQIEQAGRIAQNQALIGIGGLNLSAAGQLGQFSDQRQRMEMERLNAMMGVGGMERNLYQRGLDVGYDDFMRQQAYPWEQLSRYSNILYGQPIRMNQNSTTTQPGASPWEQLLGAGIAAYGMYNAYQDGWG